MNQNANKNQVNAQRAAARRTALILGAVALAIFVGFFLSGAKIL